MAKAETGRESFAVTPPPGNQASDLEKLCFFPVLFVHWQTLLIKSTYAPYGKSRKLRKVRKIKIICNSVQQR